MVSGTIIAPSKILDERVLPHGHHNLPWLGFGRLLQYSPNNNSESVIALSLICPVGIGMVFFLIFDLVLQQLPCYLSPWETR